MEICPECTRENIDEEELSCLAELPPLMVYGFRVSGTVESDSDDLAATLTNWGRAGYMFTLSDLLEPSTPGPPEERDSIIGAIAAGLVTLVVVMAASVVAWRCHRAFRQTKMKRQ